jgi:predicted membrane channel-forming protein YqfA (hemolysin III family)
MIKNIVQKLGIVALLAGCVLTIIYNTRQKSWYLVYLGIIVFVGTSAYIYAPKKGVKNG